MPPPGTPCRYLQDTTSGRVTVVYLDDPRNPYVVDLDIRQVDLRLPPEDSGRTVRLLWYGQRGEHGVRLLREEQATVEVILAPDAPERADRAAVLASPVCLVEAFAAGKGGPPEPVGVTRHLLLAASQAPQATWDPAPSGEHARVARAHRPPGTAGWKCLLCAFEFADQVPVLVRVLYSAPTLAEALRSLEDAAWRELPREFVVACCAASAAGRACRGFEGPTLAGGAPWLGEPPSSPPPALKGKEVDAFVEEVLRALERGEAPDLPARGTDAYRVCSRLGRELWRPEAMARIGRSYVGREQAPSLLVWAVALHALLRHPLEVEHAGRKFRPADLWSGPELWPQLCEWALAGAPGEFLAWAYPDGLYRASEMLEPAEKDVPDPQLARGVEQALVERAEAEARYVPHGAFVLEVPEELFLRRWGVRELWLWVDGRRVWCALAGEDGTPRESFAWEAGRGVLTNVLVPLRAAPAVGAALAAVWHDMVVAGEQATPRAEGRYRAPRTAPGGEAVPGSRAAPKEAVFPRRSTSRLVLSGRRSWGGEEDRRAVRRAHAVRGHLRALWSGRKATEAARAFAAQHGLVLPAGYTFVRPHVRGRRAGGEEPAPEPVRVRARGLATVAVLLK